MSDGHWQLEGAQRSFSRPLEGARRSGRGHGGFTTASAVKQDGPVSEQSRPVQTILGSYHKLTADERQK
jgi:hypothetical protein